MVMKDIMKILTFCCFFPSVLIVLLAFLGQLLGMLIHRWGTFLHLIASTHLTWFHSNEREELAITAIHEAQKLTSASAEGDIDLINPPQADYSDDDDNDDATTTAPTLSPSATHGDLHALEEQAEDEEEEAPPDYSDDDETDFNGRPSGNVQYDAVFNKRFLTVRKHIQRHQSISRPGLYDAPHRAIYAGGGSANGGVGGGVGGWSHYTQQNHHALPSRYRTQRHRQFERRQSLYTIDNQRPRRDSVLRI
jgi:hypothetical protein